MDFVYQSDWVMAETFNKLVFCCYCCQAGRTVLRELRLAIRSASSVCKSDRKNRFKIWFIVSAPHHDWGGDGAGRRWLTSSAHHFHPCVMAWCLKQILGLTYLSVTTPDDESSLRQWSKLKVNPLWIFGQLLIDSIVSHCISQRQEKLLIVVKH